MLLVIQEASLTLIEVAVLLFVCLECDTYLNLEFQMMNPLSAYMKKYNLSLI